MDFLLPEQMRHAGQENGRLKAPHAQLEAFGIAPQYIAAAAITNAETLGLVDGQRGGIRVATMYAITWLPLHDGTPATNRWQAYRNPKLKPLPAAPKSENLPDKSKVALPHKRKADEANLPHIEKADGHENLPYKGKALSRKDSYQGGTLGSVSQWRGEVQSGSDQEPEEEARSYSHGKPEPSGTQVGTKKIRMVL